MPALTKWSATLSLLLGSSFAYSSTRKIRQVLEYGTSSWILTTYLLTGAVMTPIAAKLSDILSKMLAPRCQFSKLSRG